MLAFMQAPSLHVHQHESTEGHEGDLLHTHVAHFEAPPSGQPEWRDIDPDDDARFVEWIAKGRADSGFAHVAVTSADIAFPLPVLSECQTIIHQPRTHDPPVFHIFRPRAPPV